MLLIEELNTDFCHYIIRDDLFPFLYGGNKARKALEYERTLKQNGYNAIVTTGGIQSNHCRVMSLLAAKNQWDCHIVFHGSKERFETEAGNALIVKRTNTTYEFVDPSEISNEMDNAMNSFVREGKKPFYVTGGGHDLAGGIAYIKATEELAEKIQRNHIHIDRIFLPTGTGSTQAGIVTGLEKCGLNNVEVIGISVARKRERATEVTTEFTSMLFEHFSLNLPLSNKINISDDYLLGGYEGTTKDVQKWLQEITKSCGILFDTTYSGKALWGMKELIRKNNWENDNNLFWHTGGLMNILA